MIKQIRNESGYSLVEVMVSILLLSVAIIPMVGMFDAGLRAATSSGNYDKARSLANKQLEIAKNSSYEAVNSTANDLPDPDPVYSSFRYDVTKQCVSMSADASNKEFTDVSCTPDPGMVRVKVTVKWSNGSNSYDTSGVIGR